MTLCPIALAVGCEKCFVVGICPLKKVIGNFESGNQMPGEQAASEDPQEEAEATEGGGEPDPGGDNAEE